MASLNEKIPFDTAEFLKNDVNERIAGLSAIQRLVKALSLLNGNNDSNRILLELYNENVKDYADYMSESVTGERKAEIETKFEQNEELWNLVAIDNADKIDDTKKINAFKGYFMQNCWQIFMRKQLGDDLAIKYLTIVLNDKNLRRKFKNMEPQQTLQKIMNGEITAREINVLQTALTLIDKRIEVDKKVSVMLDDTKNTIKQDNFAAEPLYYDSFPEMKNIAVCFRDDFAYGAKKDFLPIMGTFFDCGHYLAQNQIKKTQMSSDTAKTMSKSDYKKMQNMLCKIFPEHDDICDRLFLNDKKTNEKVVETPQMLGFMKKSEELYYKFLTAIIVEKNRQEPTYREYGTFLQNIKLYIDDLKNSLNRPAITLHLRDESNAHSARDIISDAADNQVIAIHHNEPPIAATLDLYLRQHPELHKPQELSLFKEAYLQKHPEITEQIAIYQKKHQEQNLPKATVLDRLLFQKLKVGFGMAVFEESEDNEIYRRLIACGSLKETEAIKLKIEKKEIAELYRQCFPQTSLKTKELKLEILKLVNNIPNFVMPISRAAHQKLEANGMLIIGQKRNTICFAADYTEQEFNQAIAIAKRYFPELSDKMQQYARPQKNQYKVAVTAGLNFPDDIMQKYRPKSIANDKHSETALKNIVQNAWVRRY